MGLSLSLWRKAESKAIKCPKLRRRSKNPSWLWRRKKHVKRMVYIWTTKTNWASKKITLEVWKLCLRLLTKSCPNRTNEFLRETNLDNPKKGVTNGEALLVWKSPINSLFRVYKFSKDSLTFSLSILPRILLSSILKLSPIQAIFPHLAIDVWYWVLIF